MFAHAWSLSEVEMQSLRQVERFPPFKDNVTKIRGKCRFIFIWTASFLPMTKMSFHSFQWQGCRCYDLAMTVSLHCETWAWDKSPARKSDDATGRRHCETWWKLQTAENDSRKKLPRPRHSDCKEESQRVQWNEILRGVYPERSDALSLRWSLSLSKCHWACGQWACGLWACRICRICRNVEVSNGLRMTDSRFVIGSGAKQSRAIDNMRINEFVIISSGHRINPLQKRVMTIQVAVIASGAKQSRGIGLNLDCFVYFDTSTGSVHRFAQ